MEIKDFNIYQVAEQKNIKFHCEYQQLTFDLIFENIKVFIEYKSIKKEIIPTIFTNQIK